MQNHKEIKLEENIKKGEFFEFFIVNLIATIGILMIAFSKFGLMELTGLIIVILCTRHLTLLTNERVR